MEKEDSKVTFYSTKNLLNPGDFRWYNKLNNNFYREKMIESFENSELIIAKDYEEITSIINDSLISEEGRLVKAEREHEFRMDEIRNENVQKREDLNYVQTPTWGFYEDDFAFKTGIDGIILPCRHAEYGDLYSIMKGINGSFSKRLKKKEAEFDSLWDLENNNYQREFLMKQDEMSKYFYSRFKIPVFEAFKFIPGYRFNNEPVGESETYEEKNGYVEFAFKRWLEKNFSKTDGSLD